MTEINVINQPSNATSDVLPVKVTPLSDEVKHDIQAVSEKVIDNQKPKDYDRPRRHQSEVDGLVLVLDIPDEFKDPNYDYHWVNDDPGNIQAAYRLDWDHVEDERLAAEKNSPDSRVSIIAGALGNGMPYRAFLMRKRKDWREIDRKAALKPLEEFDQEIRSQGIKLTDKIAEEDADKFYRPKP